MASARNLHNFTQIQIDKQAPEFWCCVNGLPLASASAVLGRQLSSHAAQKTVTDYPLSKYHELSLK